MNDILILAEATIVFEEVVSNIETAIEEPMAEYYDHIFLGELKQYPLSR